MTKKIIFMGILMLIALLPCFHVKAQISDFNLSDYKYADYKRQGIDFDFNLIGDTYHNKKTDSLYDTGLNFNENLKSQYFYIKSNRINVINYAVGIDSKNVNQKYWRDTLSDSKASDFSNSIWISTNNLFYTSKEYFLNLGLYTSIGFNKSKLQDKYYTNGQWLERHNIEYNALVSQVSPSIGIGKGRIEPVEDARHALYILEELKKANKLKREPSHDEILLIAKRITELKNERSLDFRLHKIHELEQIDSLFTNLDLIDNNGIVYFSRLNDMWNYGGLIQRSAGFRIGLYYRPSFEYNREKNISIPDTLVSKSFRNGISFEMSWCKPIKQKYQSDFSMGIRASNQNIDNEYFNPNTQSIEPYARYSFGIYPNTRTSLVFETYFSNDNFESDYFDVFSNDYVRYKSSLTTLIPGISIKYYFSPNLRLNLGYSVTARWINNIQGEEIKINSLSNNLNISILYSVF